LGLLTYLRLIQSAIEDLLYARAINRIRRYYLELDPAAPSWVLLGGHDDIRGVMANMGLAPTARHLLSRTASTVAVMTSIIGGVFMSLGLAGWAPIGCPWPSPPRPEFWWPLRRWRCSGVARPGDGARPS